jgi:hypothetical protein
MTFSMQRGILLLGAAVLLTAATFAPPSPGQGPQGAQLLTTCPSLRCPNGQILSCTASFCGSNDNCSIFCAGHIVRCAGPCIEE